MKKLASLLFIVSVAISACSSQVAEKSEAKKADPAEVEHSGPVKLDKQKFLDEIVDYEMNPKEWIYKGKLPGLIDFYADWCRPCRMTSPIIEELAEEYKGKINVYKIDIQAEQELAALFGIQSIPTFLFIPMHDTPVMSSGIAATPEATKAMFKEQINEILLRDNTN